MQTTRPPSFAGRGGHGTAARLRVHAPFLVLLALYLTLGTLYATRTPAWQTPDEPAHYNYVRQLATERRLPLMQPGDYDQLYQTTIVTARFHPALSIAEIEYEDYQPPLYYLLLAPVYWLSGGALTALRLTSLLLGAGSVALCYATGRRLLPGRPWLPLTAAAFVALLPQQLAIVSSVNNDALAGLLIAAMLYVALAGPWTARRLLLLGLLLGLAFLTKVTAYLMAGVLGLLLLWQHWGNWRALLRDGTRLLAPALLIGLLWWGRNVLVYPGFDFLGTQVHDAIVIGQPTTAEWVADYGAGYVVWSLLRTTFRSFWGQFGWMCCPLPGWAYPPLLGLTLAGVGGLIWRRRRPDRRAAAPRGVHQRARLAFALLLGFNLLLFAVYNLRYVQHQGRYLFASLLPIGLGLALGWEAWWPRGARSARLRAWLLPLTIVVGLLGLNLYVIARILPCLRVEGC